MSQKIIYTYTDEAPFLATQSFLPVVKAYAKAANVDVDTKDISLAARILSQFPESLSDAQKVPDDLALLGELVNNPDANIIKLPNISASIPQLKAAISELQQKGFKIPDYPENTKNNDETIIKRRYAKVLGSAVNPVLREGNSDRRVAPPVKEFAKKHPHGLGSWSNNSKTHVAFMSEGDFYGSEKSHTFEAPTTVSIVHVDEKGNRTTLKSDLAILEGEIFDASYMDVAQLRAFFKSEINDAKAQNVLLSLHMKATMMKVSDPIIFGHCVEIFFEELFEKHLEELASVGVDTKNGFGDVLSKIEKLSTESQEAIRKTIDEIYAKRPKLAMVDSDKGITNLHVPSDIIIDASMPAMLKTSGQMWGPDGKPADTKALIPDRCYSQIYQTVIEFCQKHGAFDVSTMGNVANVGLMAKKAEEYGSHDKTFEITADGKVEVITADGSVILQHAVKKNDIWRGCQTKDVAIRDWVKLGVARARATGAAAVFWLDKDRGHDAALIQKVETYLADHDTSGLEIKILAPVDAMQYTLERVKEGLDTISVTGNVLRDYLTDLFPILELGTSAKMLSIVPLLAGGGLYETGAGGSAPKHVQQFVKEGHLRWDSLGEFLALGVAIEELGIKSKNDKAIILGKSLEQAIASLLDKDKSPKRKVNELDNRGSHFYLSLYWAQQVAAQSEDSALAAQFKPMASFLEENEKQILAEIDATQGKPMDIGGYYYPDLEKLSQCMRPSSTWNQGLQDHL